MSTPALESFSDEQKQYLAGFAAGSGIARSLRVPGSTAAAPASNTPARPEDIHAAAQDRFTAAGKTLSNEELAKRKKHGLDVWDDLLAHARDGKFPKGTDVFLFKFQGLFYVAPAQDSFMCRLRFPAGIVRSDQLRGIAHLAEQYAGGYADITTRANFQLREIAPRNTVELLLGLHELGIINRGAGADNVRNITATPTSGLDPQELIDVRPLARQLHHYILNHRELYGLPRKFNVAFDSGGTVSVLEDTNDIGFAAVCASEGKGVPPGIYFRMQLAGITGHQQFASDSGILIKPEECLEVAVAVIRAFIEHGDRADRKKARLKYVLDRMGMAAFMTEVERHLGRKLDRHPPGIHEARTPTRPFAHVGVHPQKQPGRHYIGVNAPAARLRADQLRALSDLADSFGSGEVRLTVWQSILIPDIRTEHLDSTQQRIEQAGLSWSPATIRSGLVACTGNGGCRYAASDTKRHAMRIADHFDANGISIDQPLNIHLTGCPHSCAQHYIGDIGLLGTKIGDEAIEGYHIHAGGGFGVNQAIGKEVLRDVPADDVPRVIERMIRAYEQNRNDASETFPQFVRGRSTEELKKIFALDPVEVAG